MRAWRVIAAAAAAVLLLGVSGCVSEETQSTPTGPNGYTLGGTLDGVEIWHDYSEEGGVMDVVLRSADDGLLGLCLGEPVTRCTEGNVYAQPYVIYIGPAEAQSAQLVWAGGEPIEMTPANEGVADDAPHVFLATPPALVQGQAATPSVTFFNEAGEEL